MSGPKKKRTDRSEGAQSNFENRLASWAARFSTEFVRRLNESDLAAVASPPLPRSSNTSNAPSTAAALSIHRSSTPEQVPTLLDSSPPSEYVKNRREPFRPEEHKLAWEYIHMKIKEAERLNLDMVRPKGKTIWEEFVRETNTKRCASNWSSHFRRQMCPKLHEMDLKKEEILYLYQNIDIEVNDALKAIIERKFNVKIRLDQYRHVAAWENSKDVDDSTEDDDVTNLFTSSSASEQNQSGAENSNQKRRFETNETPETSSPKDQADLRLELQQAPAGNVSSEQQSEPLNACAPEFPIRQPVSCDILGDEMDSEPLGVVVVANPIEPMNGSTDSIDQRAIADGEESPINDIAARRSVTSEIVCKRKDVFDTCIKMLRKAHGLKPIF